MIKEAAIKRISDGKVWTGRRHGNVIKKIYDETCIKPVGPSKFIQGFVTDNDIFVDRHEAYIIAVDCNQLEPCTIQVLMSEDLY